MANEEHFPGKGRLLQAAALQYDQERHQAPVVVAKGSRIVAEKIIALAKKHDIPLQRDPELLQILMKLEINQEIPENIFHAVAEILAMVYRANRNFSGNKL
ncbi:MAG: EscU/YscU/HrcU family type III secretion system export apparatus switch protein [Deltaproteobacteria bacterium]|nr:EscU/YscU/HrcU family type III secretion system export apparatus switch protein [Deltaproteobacteria bacterium]